MATQQHTEHTEVPHSGGFPPFQKDTFASQLFWLAITEALGIFSLLIALLLLFGI